MKKFLMPSIKLTLVMIILCSVIYPLIVAGIAKMAPGQGKGVTLTQNGKVVGYERVGQNFTDAKYFSGRPSAVDYNAAGSGGSNKGPSNPEYLQTVKDRVDSFLVHNPGVNKSEIPTDLVTASASGLDPNISVAAAKVQVKRISKIRGIAEGDLQQLIASNTEKPLAGMFGSEKINVLKLNLALDNLK